jgi:CheY-like chemotaxis protein
MPQANIFGGRRILVVEDDWLIVAELVQELEASGAHVIGPIPTLQQALRKLDEMPDMSGAILDVNLRGQMVFPLAAELRRRNIPFVFATAYESGVFPADYRDVPVVRKGAGVDEVAGLLLNKHTAGSALSAAEHYTPISPSADC